jgi:restriction endonuclease S subunit
MDFENVSKNALGLSKSHTVSLRDVAQLSVGYPFRNTCVPGESGTLACFLRDVDSDGSLNVGSLRRVEDVKPNGSHLAVAGDIVFRSRGGSFVSAIVPTLNEDLLVVAPMIRIRVNRERVLPEYLVWYMNGANGTAFFKEFAKGSAMPLISKTVLEQMPIKLPSLQAQQNIVELVELGRREHEIMAEIVKQKNLILETEISKYLESL